MQHANRSGTCRGNCFYVALHAIFPSIANVPNPFGPDVTMTGGRLIGFVLSWLANLSCAFFEVHKFKKLIPFKAFVMMICLLSFFGWAVHLAGGVGPIISQGSNIPEGQSKGWVGFLSFSFKEKSFY
jgi:NCS1 family nucleobase:cation symporter-1